jgi:two-component system, response regulator PdtaR
MENPQRIFIVEDEALSAFYLIMKLKDMGFSVDATLASGEEAVARAETYRPDLILMDINLAGAMNGIEATKRIKERFEVPVIFISGYSDEELRSRAAELDPVAFLVKPVDTKLLRERIFSVLGDPAAGPGGARG